MIIQSSDEEKISKKIKSILPQRVHTLLPLIRKVFLYTLLILSCIYFGMYLSNTGRNIKMGLWSNSVLKHQLAFIPNYLGSLFTTAPQLYIDIKFKHVQKLSLKREQALKDNYLNVSDDDWVPAKIKSENKTFDVDLRIKGDLGDHWRHPNKWSFKIKVKGDQSILGMKRFAIQDPITRNYMSEWYFHRLLKANRLIALRYSFINVTINGNDLGIYAIEENFGKRLLENNQRKEGPIFKFKTESFWGQREAMLDPFNSAKIEVYQENKVNSDPVLLEQYQTALSQMELFRNGQLNVAEVFDINLMATFFAVLDVFGYHHAGSIDNLKFYYNPISSLIEPIGYDNGNVIPIENNLLGNNKLLNDKNDSWLNHLFSDEDFMAEYMKALSKISTSENINHFLKSIQNDAEEMRDILHLSDPWYVDNLIEIIESNAAKIRKLMNADNFLHSYFNRIIDNRLEFIVANSHKLPAQIKSIQINEQIVTLDKKTIIASNSINASIRYDTLIINLPENFVWHDSLRFDMSMHYTLLNHQKSLSENITAYAPINKKYSHSIIELKQSNIKRFPFIDLDSANNFISFRQGAWELNENLIIPHGYKVKSKSPFTLKLNNSANVISYSAIDFKGEKDNPILIHANQGQSFTVINAGDTSHLEHVRFVGLKNPKINSWSLTGAVNFYKSDVTLNYVSFNDNRSEDALNIIRSDFTMANTSFLRTQADAFDGDFVSGKISGSRFDNIGNDAIDFSGSDVIIEETHISQVGDKGISCGENSSVEISSSQINDTELAISSKDKSNVSISQSIIKRSKVALTIFIKKPEYGPANISVNDTQFISVDSLYLLEEGSTLRIDGLAKKVNEKNVEQYLYGTVYGRKSN